MYYIERERIIHREQEEDADLLKTDNEKKCFQRREREIANDKAR